MIFSMEVMTLVFHFVITIAVLIGYIFTIIKGSPDETLKNLLMVIGGYWFGALASTAVKNSTTKKDTSGSTDTSNNGGGTNP